MIIIKTWKISHGDIAFNLEGKVSEVSGSSKITQDLKNWLLNYKGYNKFHPFLGTVLDDFIGQPLSSKLLASIKESITDALNLYMDEQMEDLRLRIQEMGDPILAIGQAEPSSIVKSWTGVSVKDEADVIRVNIGFVTFTNDVEELSFYISGGGSY